MMTRQRGYFLRSICLRWYGDRNRFEIVVLCHLYILFFSTCCCHQSTTYLWLSFMDTETFWVLPKGRIISPAITYAINKPKGISGAIYSANPHSSPEQQIDLDQVSHDKVNYIVQEEGNRKYFKSSWHTFVQVLHLFL